MKMLRQCVWDTEFANLATPDLRRPGLVQTDEKYYTKTDFTMSEKDKEKKPIGSRSAMWCEYLRNFQHNRLSDKALITTIKEIVFDKESLRCLLTEVRAGRRVFKQQCLKREIPYHVHCTLLEIDDADLAFNVVLSHGVWKDVVKICANEGVTRKSRDAAFKKAAQQCRWEDIMQMVETIPSGCAVNSRAVFQEMVRWGKLPLAAELLEKGVSVTDGDLNFAIRACLRLDQLDYVFNFVKRMTSLDNYRALLVRVVKAIVPFGTLARFLELAKSQIVLFNVNFVKALFKVSLRMQQCEFVIQFCQSTELGWFASEIVEYAVVAAIETCQWQAVKKLCDFRIDGRKFLLILKKCIKSREKRSKICPSLDKWCTKIDLHEVAIEMKVLFLKANSDMADWCCTERLHNLGLLVSLASENLTTLKTNLEELGSAVNKMLLVECVQSMSYMHDVNIIVEILKYLSIDDIDLEYMFEDDMLGTLAESCREEGMVEWTIHIAAFAGEWRSVEREMADHDDIPIPLIDSVILEAAKAEEWTLVKVLTNRCSQREKLLFELLESIISLGETENALDTARTILEKVDPSQARHHSFGRSLLKQAVVSSSDRERMLQLCISTGVSTHELYNSYLSYWFTNCSATKTALQNGQLPLVKLLYQSGAASSEELYQLKSDQSLKTRLQGQGRADIVSYVDHAASIPRKLQDLCRLRVSHLIGCHPGRNDRLELLRLPSIVKDLVRFKDLL